MPFQYDSRYLEAAQCHRLQHKKRAAHHRAARIPNQARQIEARQMQLDTSPLQGLGRLELLRLLQALLCHFYVLPLKLPLWGDVNSHAIGAPMSTFYGTS